MRTILNCLSGAVCCLVVSIAVDVEWLGQVNQPVAEAVMSAPGRIEPLLPRSIGRDEGKALWEQERPEVDAAWRRFLGPMPTPPGNEFQVLKRDVSTIERILIEYQSEPGLRVQAYLLKPLQAKPKMAAVVALHQTTDASIDEIAGVSGRDAMQIGRKLAERGFIVLCPRCFLWQDAATLNDAVAMHRKRHPQTLGMAKMLYDASRAVDILESLPEVDDHRIGAIGHSLGAKETLYLAAFDPRIRAAVASEGGIGFRSTNWDAPWYLGDSIRDEAFALNHHQLLALIAPRPFLVVGGETGPGAADGDRSWVLMNAAMPVWELYGSPSRLGLLNHHEGHSVPDDVFEKMAEWLQVYLAN